MVPSLRADFNGRFTSEKYNTLLRRMNERTRTDVQIRIAETPVFMTEDLAGQMIDAGAEMTKQLVGNREYLALAQSTIPPEFRVANMDAHPNFMTADFGLVRTADGTLEPRLVELQAFPSVYGYQAVLAEEYVRCFELDPSLQIYLGGLDEAGFWEAMRRVIVGTHDPAEVILMEVTPELQKTVPDFRVQEDRLGIRMVDITAVTQEGSKLFYMRDGVKTRVRRIYNRAIVDELVRKHIKPGFDLTADVDVEWAGHPNWYFAISKLSIPYVKHRFVPPTVFLDAWMRGEGRDLLSANREDWILKPLFSFAGRGIEFAPSDELLQSIPEEQRGEYLLQLRMNFEPVIETPFGMTQAEIRVLYLWPDDGELQPVITLSRLGRGKMMGVDHNRNQEWVGGSATLITPTG